MGDIDGKLILNTASFGSYAELVNTRERLEDRIGKVAGDGRYARPGPAPFASQVIEIDRRRRTVSMIFIDNRSAVAAYESHAG